MGLNINSGYGQAMLGRLIAPTFGRTFVVFNSSDNNKDEVQRLFETDYNGVVRYFTSIDAAVSALDSNRNDTIVLNTQGTHSSTTGIDLSSLNRVHIMSLDTLMGIRRKTGQRAKVQLDTTGNAAAIAATLLASGTGCSIQDIKWMNSGTNAASKASAIFNGEANYIAGNSFMKFSDLDQTGVADVILSGDSDTFEHNEFGFDTLVQSVARPTALIDGYGGKQLTRLEMYDNNFICQSSSADKVHVKVNDTAALRYTNRFERCSFDAAINATNSAVTLTNAVASVSGLVEGNIHFIDCPTTCTNFCAGTTDNVKVSKSASSNNANESVTPA